MRRPGAKETMAATREWFRQSRRGKELTPNPRLAR